MIEISQSEFEVLAAVAEQVPANAEQVVERLNRQKPWHEKTVKTLLNRMVNKGALSFEKQGRQYWYTPLLTPNEYRISQSTSLISRLFAGRVAPLVAGFAKQQPLAQQDIDELKQLIAQWEAAQDQEQK